MTIYLKYVAFFVAFTAALLVAAFLLEKDHQKVFYDLTIAGAGFAAAIAATLTVVDRILKRREQDEWSFVRRMALRQIRSALQSMALSFALCFVDSAEVADYLESDPEAAKKYAAFAKALRSRPAWAEKLKEGDGDKLLGARADYGPVAKDMCSVQFDRLVQSKCERELIDAIVSFDDNWRTFDGNLTSWSKFTAEEKAKLKIEWARYVSDILSRMATIEGLSRNALQRLEQDTADQKV